METKDILKQLREKNNYSIKDVANGTKMQYTMCREYESGDRRLGMSAAIKFADFYNVSIDYLLGRSDAKPPEDPIKLAAQEFHLDSAQRGILAAYLYMDPDDRKQFISYIKQIVEGVGKEDSSIKSRIQKKGMSSIAHAVRAAARSNGIKAVVVDDDGHIMTKEQIDAIQNTPEMDTDL